MGKQLITQLDSIFKPRSMAVIGASAEPWKWGHWSISGSLANNFTGKIYPVNPRRKEILGIKTYPNILDIPDDVDLAVIAVSAPYAATAMSECVRKKVKGAVILSGGFAETGVEGTTLQEEILKIARQGGIRIVGPNCPGISNKSVGLCVGADFQVDNGPISFVSQSGTLSGLMIRKIPAKSCGINKFIGAGNQADLCSTDYLEYLGEDAETKVIVLYIEGFPGINTEGKRFFNIVRKITQKKPVIIYKAGRTSSGQRSALSHTASIAGSDELFDGLCRQAGVIRAYETDHAFTMAEALAKQPLPGGNRVGIVSGGGALCVTIAEQCDLLGLEIPKFDEATAMDLKRDLVPFAPIPWNPIDIIAGSGLPITIPIVSEKIIKLPYIDGIIANPIPLISNSVDGLCVSEEQINAVTKAAQNIADLSVAYGKPVIVLSNHADETTLNIFKKAGVPFYETPEDCARAMFALTYYAEFLKKKQFPEF